MKLERDYIELHAQGKFPGTTVLRFKDPIANIIRMHECKTALDFGCGKGSAYLNNHLDDDWGIDVELYDPFYEVHCKKPEGTFDLVLCIDVVEHVPEEEVIDLLSTLFEHATKAVVVTFCNRPARKTLPITGGNAHCTQKDRQWWEDQLNIARMATDKLGVPFYLFENVS